MKTRAFTRMLVIGVVAFVLLLGALWLGISLRNRAAHNALRRQVSCTFTAATMDQQARAVLAEAQSSWTCKQDTTNGPIADAMRLAGLSPSVRDLIRVFTTPMPEYCWWRPSQNVKATVLGTAKYLYADCGDSGDVQALLRMVRSEPAGAADHTTLQVSDDGHLALVWRSPTWIVVFRDEASGMREVEYSKER